VVWSNCFKQFNLSEGIVDIVLNASSIQRPFITLCGFVSDIIAILEKPNRRLAY
jgi:hypothetical protein